MEAWRLRKRLSLRCFSGASAPEKHLFQPGSGVRIDRFARDLR